MKKLLVPVVALTMAMSCSTFVHAEEVTSNLTPEQEAVINSYESTSVSSVEALNIASEQRATARSSWRGSYYRGNTLMWSEDFVEWSISGGKVTSSTAWQNVGYVFPNIARAKGISRHSTSAGSVTYRASKTIGAGVVTPWGDITVYEQDYTDFLRANGNGTMTVWQ